MVNGETMQSLKPENSVKLIGGGKVQVSHDSECNRKCERTRGDLDARIEVKTSKPVSSFQTNLGLYYLERSEDFRTTTEFRRRRLPHKRCHDT